MALVPVFDLDGTLLDSDDALVDAFVRLGVARDRISFGHVIGTECERLGLALDDYVEAYDTAAAMPFPGVGGLLGRLARWGVCSNKDARSGRAELARLGWSPEVARFTQDFGGRPKQLAPVLEALGLGPGEVVFVGDSAHDAHCAREAGCTFAVAAWNPRTRAAGLGGDVVLERPEDLLAFLGS